MPFSTVICLTYIVPYSTYSCYTYTVVYSIVVCPTYIVPYSTVTSYNYTVPYSASGENPYKMYVLEKERMLAAITTLLSNTSN